VGICVWRVGVVFFFQAEDGIRAIGVTGSDVCSSDLDKLLLTNREFKVARNSKFIVPVIAEESAPPQAGSITVTNVTFDAPNNDYIITFNAVGNYSGFTVDASNQFQQFVKGVNQTTSPINVGLDFVNSFGIEFDLFLVGFDNDSGQNIQSNTFNYIE